MRRMKQLKLVTSIALPILLGVALMAALVGRVAASPTLVLVSGPSPFTPGCEGVAQTGTNFLNAEVEPWMAVNPMHQNNFIGVWQQDRWSNGGAHGLVAGFSFNGGKTWGETTLPFSKCAPGGVNYERASDPWVSIGPDGTAYAIAISFNNSNNNNAVVAATSTDGGKTWGNVFQIITDNAPNFQFFNDKESVTADPTTPGEAYAVWDRLETPNGNPDANLHTAAFKGPTLFSKTTNGGQTWSAPRVIVDFGSSRKQTIGNQIVIDPRTGTLYNFFDLIVPPMSPSAFKLAFIKSTDDGDTWTAPQIIANIQTVGVFDPNTGELVRTSDIIPEVAIDPATGQLYAVWQDSRFTGGEFDEVALATSTDGGATWSAPIRVNTNTPTTRPGFTPSIAVNAAGTVGVTFYDFRNLGSETATLPTDTWLVTSTNGGASFGNEAHLAPSFDMKTAPFARGFFVGDYEVLGTVGTTFVPFFVTANSGNTSSRTDVFATTV